MAPDRLRRGIRCTKERRAVASLSLVPGGLATVPLILVRRSVEQLQLVFGLTGALLLPLLALTLLIMNNREEW